MRPILPLLAVLASSCGRLPVQAAPRDEASHAIVHEQFSEASLATSWLVVAPKVAGAIAAVENGELTLTMPSGNDEEIAVRRTLDVTGMRGNRIRLSARVRTDAAGGGFARATLTMVNELGRPSYRDAASTSSVDTPTWTDVHTVIDVDDTMTAGQLDLVLHGSGTAHFDDIQIAAVGLAPAPKTIQLSPQQIDRIVTFARAAAVIRYLHPSDQAATLDWNAFLTDAIGRILDTPTQADFADQLAALFEQVAPTVVFSRPGESAPRPSPQHGDTARVVRWHRYGLGTSAPFAMFREGRDVDRTSAIALTRVDLDTSTCKKIHLDARVHKLPGPGKAALVARLLQPVTKKQEVLEPIKDTSPAAAIVADVPTATQAIEVGIQITGRAGATIEALQVSCNAGPPRAVALTGSEWTYTGYTDLYTWSPSACDGRPCARLVRNPEDTSIDPVRDHLHRDIGSGIEIDAPLAVWSERDRTLPEVPGKPVLRDFTIDDPALRLAAIAAVWGTLSLFYPYFDDQHIHWLDALPAALNEAAAASSPRETRAALAHLLARLQDNHARVTHRGAPVTGVLPVTFRRFGDKLAITGGVPAYLKSMGLGSEIEEIDGVRATLAYDVTAAQVSAATEGLREYLTPWRMAAGHPGTFRRLRVRDRNGRVVDRVLPLVSDELYLHVDREPRPAEGTELAPGVFYVDLDALSKEDWETLIPVLQRASAIVIDFRGYVTLQTLELLSHITDHALESPIWETPLVPSAGGPRYLAGHWEVRPQLPRFAAKIVGLVDARAMSAVETALHMFCENRLGVLVGEGSGGTNGNATYLEAPGGFEIRFTALRASSRDGSTVQGHGFAPDRVVHPTLDGVRAGRDEILEAGVAVARQLVTP